MVDDSEIDDELLAVSMSPQETAALVGTAKKEIETRCKAAGLAVQDVSDAGAVSLKIGMKCGREIRWLFLGSGKRISELLSVPFEKWIFLSDYDAICSYQDQMIEAAIRHSSTGFMPQTLAFRKLFEPDERGEQSQQLKIELQPPQSGLPRIEISSASETFAKLVFPSSARITLKIYGCNVGTHEQALALLKRVSGSVFFQIDLLADVALALGRRRPLGMRRLRKKVNLAEELQYPKTEFDDAPLSLYSYARSASGMPLLQFLAFYQAIEFYFPIYSRAEAQRKLKAILKDPTFRGDRDADIGKLLSAITVSRSGSYGDERSQLRATLSECINAESLRLFLESDADRAVFYVTKSKGLSYHRIPLANPNADLRADVADRIYDIRCKIVHTKNDSGIGDVELLLPFSREAEQLSYDIELVQYVAQETLIAGSLPFQAGT